MAPERGAHLRVKAAVWLALRNAVRAAGVTCQALPDGATIETGESDYEPDAVVNCGTPMADNAIAAPNPVIIVEVLSPRIRHADTGGKLADYIPGPESVASLPDLSTPHRARYHPSPPGAGGYPRPGSSLTGALPWTRRASRSALKRSTRPTDPSFSDAATCAGTATSGPPRRAAPRSAVVVRGACSTSRAAAANSAHREQARTKH